MSINKSLKKSLNRFKIISHFLIADKNIRCKFKFPRLFILELRQKNKIDFAKNRCFVNYFVFLLVSYVIFQLRKILENNLQIHQLRPLCYQIPLNMLKIRVIHCSIQYLKDLKQIWFDFEWDYKFPVCLVYKLNILE